MINGWVKYFKDGTVEEGYDALVEAGKASWSQGRLDEIIRTKICHNDVAISLKGRGEFWQSDTFEARMLVNEGRLVKRTLYKKIDKEDTCILVSYSLTKNHTIISVLQDLPITPTGRKAIKPEDVGRWLILEIENGKANWRIGDL